MHDGVTGPVLVTGGASGLGRSVVDALLGTGVETLVLDRQEPRHDVPHEVVDLADTEHAEAAVRRIADRHGGLTGVFTAAGIDKCGPLEDVPRDEWEHVVNVNLLGTAAVARAAVPFLRSTRGRIVMCASTLGLTVAGDASAYCASKFGVMGLGRALCKEFKGAIGVTLLVPGGMDTAFFDARDPQYQPGPDANLNEPDHVASAVLFALAQPTGCEVQEMIVTAAEEPTWP